MWEPYPKWTNRLFWYQTEHLLYPTSCSLYPLPLPWYFRFMIPWKWDIFPVLFPLLSGQLQILFIQWIPLPSEWTEECSWVPNITACESTITDENSTGSSSTEVNIIILPLNRFLHIPECICYDPMLLWIIDILEVSSGGGLIRVHTSSMGI